MSYIQPNQHGVYCPDEGDTHLTVFKTMLKRSGIEFRILEAEPGLFAAAAHLEYGCGNFFGHGSPLSAPFFTSFDEALEHLRSKAIKHFDPAGLGLRDSCVSTEQREHAAHFTSLLASGWPRNSQDGFKFQAVEERFYLFACGAGIKPVGDLDGYLLESNAMAMCRGFKWSPNDAVVCRGPYTRAAFLSINLHNGWEIVDGVARRVERKPKPLPEFCEGCGETVALCNCNRCEECGEPFESCECDDSTERELEQPETVAIIATEPEQLSLF